MITRSHLQKREETGLIGPIVEGADLPALFVRHVDRDISDQVAWSWKGTGEHGPHSPTLRRALSENELTTINARMFDLQRACAAYTDDDQPALAERLNDCFKGFPALRSLNRTEALAMVVGYLRNMKDLPPWAIAAACEKIKKNRAELNASFVPTEGEFFTVVDEMVAPYRERIAKLRELMDAPVDPPQPIRGLRLSETKSEPPTKKNAKKTP